MYIGGKGMGGHQRPGPSPPPPTRGLTQGWGHDEGNHSPISWMKKVRPSMPGQAGCLGLDCYLLLLKASPPDS